MDRTAKNICLTGYMGSGKTTVGRIASERLGAAFADTDEMIVKQHGRSIPDIFREEGETYFRKLEEELLARLADGEGLENTVLSTGGGIVLSALNRKNLKKIGKVIYLRAGAQCLYERVKNESGRPLLDTDDLMKRISEMLAVRAALYEEAADVIIDTDGLDIESTVKAVTDVFKEL